MILCGFPFGLYQLLFFRQSYSWIKQIAQSKSNQRAGPITSDPTLAESCPSRFLPPAAIGRPLLRVVSLALSSETEQTQLYFVSKETMSR